MRILMIILTVLFIALQYNLWFGQGGVVQTVSLKRSIERQRAANDKQNKNNERFIKKVQSLKADNSAAEALAREELGMVKPDETYYRFVDQHAAQNTH